MKKLAVALFAASLVSACSTTIQSRSLAEGSFQSQSAQQAMQIATAAALRAGFTIASSDANSGLIVATRGANPLLTNSNPIINIAVAQLDGRASVTVSSTVGGQIVDYGTTRKTLEDYCAAFIALAPGGNCTVSKS